MTIIPVITAPDPRLKVMALPVKEVDDTIRQLMNDMLETMYAFEGMGLAATQIGINKRVIVMEIPPEDDENDEESSIIYKMANPEVFWTSSETNTRDEACLSVPDAYGAVTRPKLIKIRYIDEHNQEQVQDADGLFATCIQHEIDHLNGVLYIDHLSKIRRERIIEKLIKNRNRKL